MTEEENTEIWKLVLQIITTIDPIDDIGIDIPAR
jgi:hypothetical protein